MLGRVLSIGGSREERLSSLYSRPARRHSVSSHCEHWPGQLLSAAHCEDDTHSDGAISSWFNSRIQHIRMRQTSDLYIVITLGRGEQIREDCLLFDLKKFRIWVNWTKLSCNLTNCIFCPLKNLCIDSFCKYNSDLKSFWHFMQYIFGILEACWSTLGRFCCWYLKSY